jgi:hypothetical protein
MRPLSRNTRHGQQGMALLGTMVILFLILGIALLGTLGRTSSVTGSADAALKQTDLQADTQTARDLAETGVRITYAWFQRQDTVNSANLPFAPSELGTDFYGTAVVGGYNVLPLSQAPDPSENPNGRSKNSQVRVRIYPGNDPGTNQRVFAIQAIGEYGSVSYTSRLVIRPKGFAEYGIFYDEPLDNFVWMAGRHVFSGPVHLNMRLPGTDTVDATALHTIVWNTTNLLFTHPGVDYFTCAAAPEQIEWLQGMVTPQIPTTSDWPSVAASGTAPRFNVPLIPFPQDSTSLQATALGGGSAPSAPSVLVPSASGVAVGGIYVAGSVSRIELGTAGTDNINQLLTFFQTDGTTSWRTVVTLDRVASQTRVERYTTPSGAAESLTTTESYSGITNGLVYVDGDIGDTATQTGGLSGVVANNASPSVLSLLTIATPASRTTQLSGGVVYQRLASGSSANPESGATQADSLCGVFALITGRMWVVDLDRDGAPIDNLTFHGALLAMDSTGGTPSAGCTRFNTRTSGIYRHLGAMVLKKDGPFGQFTYDPTTGALLAEYGFNRQRLYDTRLLELAPAFFPVANRTYQVVSFQSDVTALP